ncbi:lymphocyte antigen 96 isoform X1 [Falco peregrinus]|uniref:lymphocyte antigen 96 isoform X1 n=1 Tax=Falco peregrinus TaxID=8954 RepID=UPI00247A03C2|nr:lymphocyte antigen 96 isoform X1 [Falco peregrinus]
MTMLNFCSSFPQPKFYSVEYSAKKVTMFGLFFLILFAPGVSEFLCISSDLELSYTFCDSTAHIFMFNLTPCSIMNNFVWKAALTWIPRSDITFLKVIFYVWFDGAKAFHWKEVLCSGAADDEYSVCRRLKGETIETTFDIKGSRTNFPKGNYDIILQGFSDDSENMFICLNITMIVKQDIY